MLIGIDASRAALARHTGTETYACRLIQAMAPLADSRVRLRLYTHQPPAPRHWPTGPFVETRVIPFPRLWTHLRLAAEISRHPPDVLFVPAHVLPLYCPVPAAVTVHDLGYRHFPQAHTRFQRWYLEATTRRHARVARRIIADSEATRADLLQFYHADPARIKVVHLGLDSGLQPTSLTPAVRQKYGLPQTYLLHLGTLQPRKNLARLLAAFRQISSDFPAVHLALAGGAGWLAQDIFNRIAALKLTDRVILPGYIPEADKAALLSGALAYVFPSLYEGFGLPVLEAMACGTPVLAANTSSLPEIAGQAALLVNPLNVEAIAGGMRRLLTDESLRRSLVEKGFHRIEAFSWQKAGERIWRILLELAQESGLTV